MSELTLTDFLLARIAEAEGRYYNADSTPLNEAGALLAECDKMRGLMGVADDLEGEADDSSYGWAASVADRIRKYLALPYATHPDYRQEWAV